MLGLGASGIEQTPLEHVLEQSTHTLDVCLRQNKRVISLVGLEFFSEPAGCYCMGSIYRLLVSLYLDYYIIIMIILALILGSY